jgi:hypothetical protein
LEGAFLNDVHLEKASLREAHLEETDLSHAHLERTDLSNTHLEKSNLEYAHLEGAFLRDAHLEGAILLSASLEGADLHYAHLEGAYLNYAHLGGAGLNNAFFDSGANLEGVLFSSKGYRTSLVADVRWGGVNLAVIDWAPLKLLGDEQRARQATGLDGKVKEKDRRLGDYRAAVRANRQLSVALREQGLNEEADHFAYRAQQLQRVVLRRQGLLPKAKLWRRVQKLSGYVWSGILDGLAGYGYKPVRTLGWYLLVIFGFAWIYFHLGSIEGHPLSPGGALVFSLTSFHGRGFFPGGLSLEDTITQYAAFEAVVGLFIEISFIATFTQRFFGR